MSRQSKAQSSHQSVKFESGNPKNAYNRINILPNGFQVIEKNSLQGVLDDNGNLTIPFIYTKIGWSNNASNLVNDFIGYKNNDLWGILSLKNKRTSPAVYSALFPYLDEYLVAAKRGGNTINSKYGVINPTGKTIISFKYSLLAPYTSFLIASIVKNNVDHYGLIDKKDNIIIPFLYKKIIQLGPGTLGITNHDKKAALFSESGINLSGFEFDEILPFSKTHSIIVKNGKQGIINSNGKVVIQPVYKKFEFDDHKNIVATEYNEWQILDSKNKLQETLLYDSLSPISSNLYIAIFEDHQAVIDHRDHIVLPWKKRKIGPFKNGYTIVNEKGKYGVISNYSDQLLAIRYDSIIACEDYFISKEQISKDHVWSVYHSTGKKINPIYYDQIGGLSEGYFSVKKNGKWGFMNTNGNEVIMARYDSVGSFQWGRAIAKYKNSIGVIDQTGEWIVPARYDNLIMVSRGFYIFKSGFKYGFYREQKGEIYSTFNTISKLNYNILETDRTGKSGLFSEAGSRLLKTEYDYISPLKENSIHIVKNEDKYCILNQSGGILSGFDQNIESVGAINEGFIGIRINDKYGFIDHSSGKLRIANRYDSISRFSEEMAPIKLLGRWGYVNKAEELVVQPKYEKVKDFKNGLAIVINNGKYGLINTHGEEVLKPKYDLVKRTSFGNFISKKGNKEGLLTEKGYETIFPKYDSIEDLGNGNIIVSNHSKYGLINLKGISTIPMIYDRLIYDNLSNLYLAKKEAQTHKVNLDQ